MILKFFETWRPVAGLEGLYEVSDFGRVRGFKAPRGLRREPRVLTKRTDRNGYQQAHLYKSTRRVAASVHRLVLDAFAGACPPDHEAAHLDGDRQNNRAVNLRWVTHSENIGHKRLHGTDPRGERHPSARLTDVQASEIRARFAAGEGRASLATAFGVTSHHVWQIATGRRRKGGPQ